MAANQVQEWLNEAGLGQYAEFFAEVTEETFRSLLMQDYGKYGVTDITDKQKLFRLIKKVSSDQPTTAGYELKPAAIAQSPKRCSSAAPRLLDTSRPLLQNSLLDLDGAESDIFSEYVGGVDPLASPVALLGQLSVMKPPRASAAAPVENIDPNPPKIRVIVRKRPLNKKEVEKDDEDIVEVSMSSAALVVNEPKVKVDLTRYTEKHQFNFDAILDEDVTNDQVYATTVKPLVHTIFRGGKSTCFAYGQTGSGKTYTMQPLPIRAAEDIFRILQSSGNSDLSLQVSCFEIYGGKLYDLLNNRKRLEMREDGKKNVCIVGLEEFKVTNIDQVRELMELSNSVRSTGSTGANADSSRSHSIMQFALKRATERQPSRCVGKISFIDLAGSERGADTYDNDRQTRLEGAEINKSLLALKECIRALDNEARHIPFRGSKLTEVLRDSFVGSEARTVMIANISPTSTSCEHTLNTLRYADRVKELRKQRPNGVSDFCIPVPPVIRTMSDPSGLPRDVLATSLDPVQVSSPSRARKITKTESASPLGVRPAWQSSVANQEQGGSDVVPNFTGLTVNADLNTQQENTFQERTGMFDNDWSMDSILEAEDDLINTHRKHIEETMSFVKLEMSLLSDVDQPGSLIDEYVSNLEELLQKKSRSVYDLQQKLSSFKLKLQTNNVTKGG